MLPHDHGLALALRVDNNFDRHRNNERDADRESQAYGDSCQRRWDDNFDDICAGVSSSTRANSSNPVSSERTAARVAIRLTITREGDNGGPPSTPKPKMSNAKGTASDASPLRRFQSMRQHLFLS